MSDEKATPGPGERFCNECGAIIRAKAEICPRCGVRQFAPPPQLPARVSPPPDAQSAPNAWAPNKTKAGLLAIFFGAFGVHKFYMRRPRLGALYALSCWTFVPFIIGIAEGISYLASDRARFARRYRNASPELFRSVTTRACVVMVFFDLIILFHVSRTARRTTPGALSVIRVRTNSITPSKAASSLPVAQSRYAPQDFFGTWSTEIDGYTMQTICRLFSTTYAPGATIYRGPDAPDGVERKASYETKGDILIVEQYSNRANALYRQHFMIIDPDSIRKLREVFVTHYGSETVQTMGTLRHRCSTVAPPLSVESATSVSKSLGHQ